MPLIINTIPVNNLSGPVSMYIHIPNDNYLKEFPYAPILILFGDIHNDNTNYCNPVTNKIFDTEFLELISKLVGAKEEETEDGKVDFYVEGGEIHKILDSEEDKEEFPMKKLWNLFKKCYTNTRMKGREEYNPTCTPIKNIRWQSGDIRFFKKEEEKFDPSIFLNDISKEIQERMDKNEKENKKEDPDYTRRLSLITKRILYKQFNNIIVNDDYRFPIKTFDVIKEYITNSLINKQLNKIKSYMGDDVYSKLLIKFRTYIISMMKQSMARFTLMTNIVENEIFGKLTSITNNLKNIFNCEPFSKEEGAELEIMKTYMDSNLHSAYYLYFLDMKTVMLDLYTMARIYKTMIKSMRIHPSKRSHEKNTDAVHPLIAMCYFGNFHIENIKTFLSNDYDLKFSIDRDTTDKSSDVRCLNFMNKDYDLDSEITKLKESRKKYEQTLLKY